MSQNMNIRSSAIVDGILDNEYGGYGKKERTSFPIEWDEVAGAKSYALLLIDFDATHVVGHPYIHWVVANIKDNKLTEDATHKNEDIIQGQNSRTQVGWINFKKQEEINDKKFLENANYTGPYPPDADHTYKLIVYALDKELDLKPGFFLDQMIHAMKGHVIAKEKIEFVYKAIL